MENDAELPAEYNVLCRDLTPFGLGSESGVTKTISRLGQRMENDAELLAEYNVLCRVLTPSGLF